MELNLNKKCALVTGGSHGIGQAISLGLAKEGCNVAICSRTQDRIDHTLEMLKDYPGHFFGVVADVLKKENIDQVIAKIDEKWGRLDILINNAGGGGRWGKEDVQATSENVWQEVYDKNAMAAVRFTMPSLSYMRRNKWGRVITITSTLGMMGGGRPWFNMAKTAQMALMKNLALKPELVRDGITFNTVAPGCVMIPHTGWEEEQKKDPNAFQKMLDQKFPLGRMGTPEEVANIVVFLCSPKSGLVNGASILVDGGESTIF